MRQQLFARTGWTGKAVAAPSGEVGSLALPFDLDDEAHDDLVIKADVPKKLKKTLNNGLPIVSHSCVRRDRRPPINHHQLNKNGTRRST